MTLQTVAEFCPEWNVEPRPIAPTHPEVHHLNDQVENVAVQKVIVCFTAYW